MNHYLLRANYPNVMVEPKEEQFDNFLPAVYRALDLRRTLQYTNIYVLCTDSNLELFRIWGGPESFAPNGEARDWP